MSRYWFLLVAATLCVTGRVRGVPVEFNGISAQVNDSIITVDEVNRRSRRAMEQVARRARTQEQYEREVLQARKDVLEGLIDRRLVLHEFKTAGRNFPEAIIDDFIKDQIKREFGDRITLTKMLRESGRTFASYREEEKEMIIVYQMTRSKVSQEILISPRQIEKRYASNPERFRVGDRAKLRMILIDASRHARGEPRGIANAALARIRAGEDFAAVASEVSDDARTNKGGDRGWIDAKDKSLRNELHEAVFKLEPGKVSDVFEFDGSCFILKVEERKPAQIKPLSEVRLDLERELKQEEADRLQKAWYGRLRKKAFIRFF